MTGILSSSVATCPHQLVGYWGYDHPKKLAKLLSVVLNQASENEWNLKSFTSNKDIVATLCAGGFNSSSSANALSDAWVKITQSRLNLGREAFGRVPFYWTQIEQVIWFASRLQLLLPVVASTEVSIPALYGYSCFSYVPTPITPITNILAITAGTEQTWQGKAASRTIASPQTHRILEWYEQKEQINNETEAISELQLLLQAGIEHQIADLDDEPVGVLLSGGLDSSIVAALLVKAGVKVRAYTLDFGESGIPEYPYAEQVAHWLDIPLVKVEVTAKRMQQALLPTVEALDLPFGDGVTVPLFLLNQVASQETKIIFNGEGGDQLFAGWTNKPLIAASVYQTEHPLGKESFEQQYLRTFHRLWGYEEQVFQPAIAAQIQALQPQDWLHSALDATSATSLLHRLRRATLMLKGAQNIHPRATNLAFAHKLQVRSLFCELSLAQWTFRLSGELCLQGSCEKYILKRAVESWLPPEIVWRNKRGMGVPLTSWCLHNWWRNLGNWLNPAILQAEGRWQPKLAEQIVLGKLGGAIQGRRIGEILWLLIIWQLWRSQVLGEPVGKRTWNHPFWLPYRFWGYLH
ncbi:MAG: asparagine synthase [Symploca sp. SIO2G7]|nr:asparagine synthase [Symploca sp. SIO2G7]